MRKKFEAKFKARVALEAFKGEKTLTQIASEYGVHPNQISKWKQELVRRSEELFGKNHRFIGTDQQELADKLHRTIGELKVENDWLKKKLSLLG